MRTGKFHTEVKATWMQANNTEVSSYKRKSRGSTPVTTNQRMLLLLNCFRDISAVETKSQLQTAAALETKQPPGKMETERLKYIPSTFPRALLYAQGTSCGNSLKREACCFENFPCLFGTLRKILRCFHSSSSAYFSSKVYFSYILAPVEVFSFAHLKVS